MPPIVASQAGNFKERRQPEGSLVITRRGDEMLVPTRLLAGVVPAALLDRSFRKSEKKSRWQV